MKYAVTVTFFLDPSEDKNLEDESCAKEYMESNLNFLIDEVCYGNSTSYEIAEVSTINE